MVKKSVVLLSGGIDSTVTLYIAKKEGYECSCLIFNYNQRHKREVESAKKIADFTNCKYYLVNFILPWSKSSLLYGNDESIPTASSIDDIKVGGIPSTYVPSRNTIFLSFAASLAESIGAEDIFIGANIIDYSGYPDCRPKYLRLYEEMLKEGTAAKNINIKSPLLYKKKSEIILLGKELGVPFELTWSCYKGGAKPCLECHACILRQYGFKEANIKDPLSCA